MEDVSLEVASTVSNKRSVLEIRKMASEKDELDWIAEYVKNLKHARDSYVNTHMPMDTTGSFGSPPLVDRGTKGTNSPPGISDYSLVVLTRTQREVQRVAEAFVESGIEFKSRDYGAWVISNDGQAPLDLLRLIAYPQDNMAFQSALNNDIVRATIETEEIKSIILPKIESVMKKKRKSMLDAARECVLTDKLKGKYSLAVTRYLRKYDAWRADYERYFRKGEGARSYVYSTLKAAFSQQWKPSIERAVNEMSRSASVFDTLEEFFSAIRLEGMCT